MMGRLCHGWLGLMALDHFVSQVHLKNFYSPTLGNRKMFGMNKFTGQKFPCSSKDVCRSDEGSTNSYLSDERLVEDFLKEVEPRYNAAADALEQGHLDPEVAGVIAGFIAYVMTCSPTAMRLNLPPLKQTVETTAKLLDARGTFGPPSEALGGKSLTELLNSGAINVEVDQKYPQAIGIANILQLVSRLGHGWWDIVINDHVSESPFFTSDFPVAIERPADPRLMTRVIPIRPGLAVKITPRPRGGLTTANDIKPLKFRTVHPSAADIRAMNQTVVRCAEKLVFFRDEKSWIPDFVRKNGRYRVETVTRQIDVAKGSLLISSQEVMPCT
jgi:hypothetical protein